MAHHKKSGAYFALQSKILLGVMVLVGSILILSSSVSAINYATNKLMLDCYQDQANESTACGGLSTGSYTGAGIGPGNLSFDGNWTTLAPYGFGQININYTKPLNSIGATWLTKDAMGFNILPIPSSCWSRDVNVLSLVVKALNSPGTSYYCIGLTGGQVQLKVGQPLGDSSTYEEAVSWIMNNTALAAAENVTFTDRQQMFVRYLNLPQSTFVSGAAFNVSITNNTSPFFYSYLTTTPLLNYSSYSYSSFKIPNQVTYINMDEGTGSLAQDSYGIANLSINTAITPWTSGKYLFGLRQNDTGTSIQFNSPTISAFSVQNFTVEIWANFSTLSASDTLFNHATTNRGILIQNTGPIPKCFIGDGSSFVGTALTGNVTLNEWHHYACSYDGAVLRFYFDGILNNSLATVKTLDFTGVNTRISGDASGNTINGSIDEFKFFNITRSASDISNDMNNQTSLSGSKRTTDFSQYVRSYMITCPAVNGNCSVPITFYANNTGAIQYSNMLFHNILEIVNSNTTSGIGFETSMETFTLNLSYDTSRYHIAIATLFYCDRSPCLQYHTTANVFTNNAIFNVTFALPTVNETKFVPYHWEYQLFEDSTLFSDITGDLYNNLSVQFYPIQFSDQSCQDIPSYPVFNFTAYDEETINKIEPYSFKGTIKAWLGDGTIYKNVSFQDDAGNNIALCTIEFTLPAWMDSDIQYSDVGNVIYNPRNYYFDNISIKPTQFNSTGWPIAVQVPMFLLNKSIAVSFIENLLDQNNLPVSSALIYSNRWYPGEGIYRIVEISRTDSSGNTVAQFQTETPEYLFNITKNNVLLLTTVQQKIFPTSVPYTLFFNLANDLGLPWQPFVNSTTFSYIGPLFDNQTNLVNFSYVDTSSSFSYVRMVVFQTGAINDIPICDVNSTNSAAILTCNVSGYSGTIQVNIFTSHSPETPIFTALFIVAHTLRDSMGRLGYFMGWLIILTCFMIAIYDFSVGLVTGTASMWFVNLFGFISFGYVFLFGWTAVAIIIIWIGARQ